jgi:hypothetical protein
MYVFFCAVPSATFATSGNSLLRPLFMEPVRSGRRRCLMTVTIRRRMIAKTTELRFYADCPVNSPNGRAVPGAGRGRRCIAFLWRAQLRRELPVEAGAATAASRPTVGAASLAATHRSSDAGDELTPVFDIARIDPTGDAVIAG